MCCAAVSSGMASLSLPLLTSLAANGGGESASRWAVIDQYSCGTKIWMARSRSQMMRRATLCTRPALNPPLTLRHSSGDTW